jgi:hypothetical protein
MGKNPIKGTCKVGVLAKGDLPQGAHLAGPATPLSH